MMKRRRIPREGYYSRKYEEALGKIPESGEVASFHNAIFGAAKLGSRAGLKGDKIFADICEAGERKGHILGGRHGEIWRTIHKAFVEEGFRGNKENLPGEVPPPKKAEIRVENFKSFVEKGKGITAYDVWERSNPRPDGTAKGDGPLFLETLFAAKEQLCLTGESQCDTKTKPRDAWISALRSGNDFHSHFVINPLSGKACPSSTGKLSTRCDGAVVAYRYALAEFDSPKGTDLFPLQEQLAFWAFIQLPISSLIYSGGKSIHALIALGNSVKTAADWRRVVTNGLYGELLIPLGVDGGGRTPSHLSRLPGHLRSDGNRRQKLLYLNANPNPNGIFP
jgi:hypothetical protein